MVKGNRTKMGANIAAASVQAAPSAQPAQQATPAQTAPPDNTATPQAIQGNNQAPAGNYDGPVIITDPDGTEYRELANDDQYYLAQKANLKGNVFDVKQAMQAYTDASPDYTAKGNNQLYSKSQNLNHALAHGLPLNANEQLMYGVLQNEMHPIGGNYVLYRYDHDAYADALLKKVAGINGSYQNMSNAQIKKAFVGMQYQDNKLVSTSCNNFKNASASQKQVFTSRAVEIRYKAKPNTQCVMMRRGSGGDQGEVVLGYGQTYKIVDAYTTGQKRRTKGTQSNNSKHLVLVVEVG